MICPLFLRVLLYSRVKTSRKCKWWAWSNIRRVWYGDVSRIHWIRIHGNHRKLENHSTKKSLRIRANGSKVINAFRLPAALEDRHNGKNPSWARNPAIAVGTLLCSVERELQSYSGQVNLNLQWKSSFEGLTRGLTGGCQLRDERQLLERFLSKSLSQLDLSTSTQNKHPYSVW